MGDYEEVMETFEMNYPDVDYYRGKYHMPDGRSNRNILVICVWLDDVELFMNFAFHIDASYTSLAKKYGASDHFIEVLNSFNFC